VLLAIGRPTRFAELLPATQTAASPHGANRRSLPCAQRIRRCASSCSRSTTRDPTSRRPSATQIRCNRRRRRRVEGPLAGAQRDDEPVARGGSTCNDHSVDPCPQASFRDAW
jgi:hypothetical protein